MTPKFLHFIALFYKLVLKRKQNTSLKDDVKMKKKKICFTLSLSLIAAFILWTIAICIIDVQNIGPNNSSVGLAELNLFFHNITGVNFSLYNLTDWLGLVPVFVCIGFGSLGLTQWIKRKSFLKVDFDILILGGFYLVTIVTYLFFENLVINYRPVLINGFLEASYPSSTTLLVTCVMPTAIMQFNRRIKNKFIKRMVSFIIVLFIAFMVICRLVSGVHWFSDIIGGTLFSAGLVMTYYCIAF